MSEATPSPPRRRIDRAYVWLAIALLLGALVRFWDLTGPSLFIDEGFVFHISENQPRDILRLVAYTDFHPPLFYLVTHYLTNLLHWPLWDYRYLTAAFSLTGIAATWAIARRTFGATAAAVAAIALALNPALLEWDRLYRMYAILVALTAVSWWLLLVAIDAHSRRWLWWAAYGLAAITLPYVHYVGGLVVASQAIYALTRLRQAWPGLAAAVAAGLALLPWLWAIRVQYPHGGMVIALNSPEFSWPREIRSVIAYGLPANWMFSPQFDLFFAIVVVAILLAALYVGRKTFLPFWVLPIGVHVIASLVTGKDLVLPRYMYVYVPAFCIGLGAIVASVWQTRYRVAGLAIAAAYVGMSAVAIPNLLFVPYYQFPDWYQVNALLLQHEKPNDLIVMDQGAEYWVVYKFTGFRTHQMDGPGLPSDIDVSIRWLRGYPKRRVWYIENQPTFTDSRHRLERDLDATRPRLGAWQQLRVFREDVVRIVLYGPRFAAGAGKKSVVNTTSP